jgi:hypothetical protein
MQEVVASYFSEDAAAFRRDANLGNGFGVIVEPLIGQQIGEVIAPVLSGYGYTSVPKGEGYVNVVPGFGCGVESRYGEEISRMDAEYFDGSLHEYITFTKEMRGGPLDKKSALLRNTDPDLGWDLHYRGRAYLPGTEGINEANIEIDADMDLNLAFHQVNLLPFFDKMEAIEEVFRKPQYFEWAMTLENGQPRYWIVQIGSVDKKKSPSEAVFENRGVPILEGKDVVGTGVIETEIVVQCFDADKVEALRRFNDAHEEGYVLLYSAELTSDDPGVSNYRHAKGGRTLRYSDFTRAKSLIEFPTTIHNASPLAHFQGQLDMTGKAFGVARPDYGWNERWSAFSGGADEEDGLTVIRKPVIVVADEKLDRIALFQRE